MATKLRMNAPLGKSFVAIEADGLKALFMASGFFAAIPTKCGNCDSDDLTLDGKKNAGYDFYSVLCRKCRHELKFGQRKEDGGLYLKLDDGWQPPYKKGDGGGSGKQQGGGGGGDQRRPDDDDDIPF